MAVVGPLTGAIKYYLYFRSSFGTRCYSGVVGQKSEDYEVLEVDGEEFLLHITSSLTPIDVQYPTFKCHKDQTDVSWECSFCRSLPSRYSHFHYKCGPNKDTVLCDSCWKVKQLFKVHHDWLPALLASALTHFHVWAPLITCALIAKCLKDFLCKPA